MKKETALLLAVLSAFLLYGCFHQHTWEEATCTQPKTCSSCGVTEGEPLGHTWKDATCTEPKTCTVCGETEGDALGHTWQEATCIEPKTCSVCGTTEGEALGHQWIEATYSTPKTCSVCGETEGDPRQPLFEQYGFPVSEKLNGFTIKAIYAIDKEKQPQKTKNVDGEISFNTYMIMPSENRTGYNTIKLIYNFEINQPSSYKRGSVDTGSLYDYYTGYRFSEKETFNDETVELFDSVIIDGIKYTLYYHVDISIKFGRRLSVQITRYIDIPEGYDGLVLRFVDEDIWTDDDYNISSGQLEETDSPGYNFFIGRI